MSHFEIAGDELYSDREGTVRCSIEYKEAKALPCVLSLYCDNGPQRVEIVEEFEGSDEMVSEMVHENAKMGFRAGASKGFAAPCYRRVVAYE